MHKGKNGFRIVGVMKGKYEVRTDEGELKILNRKELENLKIEFPNWRTDF